MKSAQVSRDIASETCQLVINVGTDHEISERMGVIPENHAMGRMQWANLKTSILKLMSIPQFRIVIHMVEDAPRSPRIFYKNGREFLTKPSGLQEMF
jgi:cell shape-determining protein MreC